MRYPPFSLFTSKPLRYNSRADSQFFLNSESGLPFVLMIRQCSAKRSSLRRPVTERVDETCELPGLRDSRQWLGERDTQTGQFALRLPPISFASDRNHPISTKRPNDETRYSKPCSVSVSGLHIVRRARSELESTHGPDSESTSADSPLGERRAGSEGRRARRHSERPALSTAR